MSGKGSSPRSPFPTFFYDNRTPFQKYSDNWDAVFGKKNKVYCHEDCGTHGFHCMREGCPGHELDK